MTYQQKQEKAKAYLREHKISFGNQEADDCAVEIFIAGMESNEEKYTYAINEFKDAYIKLFKFHCEEFEKREVKPLAFGVSYTE